MKTVQKNFKQTQVNYSEFLAILVYNSGFYASYGFIVRTLLEQNKIKLKAR